jgi:cytochrome b
MTTAQTKVWDLFVRMFHWTLVIGFAVAYVTGDDAEALHEWSGYAVLGLILARTVWGFVGSRHARFADFVYGPSAIVRYTFGLLTGHPRRYLGHNPLGGLMVVALLTLLFAVSISGILALESPPLSAAAVVTPAYANGSEVDDDRHDEAEGWMTELHEALAEFTLVLVVLHIAGVLLGSWLHRENLIAAMFTGRKRPD